MLNADTIMNEVTIYEALDELRENGCPGLMLKQIELVFRANFGKTLAQLGELNVGDS